MLGRVLPLCRTYISFISGLSRQNVIKFLGYSAIGITLWNLVLVGFGFKIADHWEIISVYAKRYTYVLLPVVILIVFIIICNIKKNIGKLKKES